MAVVALQETGGETAVLGRSVYKAYGKRTSDVSVLRNLDIHVPQEAIYGLLGPSGCGKTTLLRCILGRLEIDSGEILVLGKPPNTPGHGIPGVRVGYMPQESALFSEFSMKDHLRYFGQLHGMTKKEITSRTEFLVQLLNFPEPEKLARDLSGGQQRRVSFAVALLQEAPLLILDEPTVGVDPLLRAKIWRHLRELVVQTKTTIVITTHYIEEARQADMVGLMRDGKILAEAPPSELMERHSSATLEDVFLTICESEVGVNGDGDAVINDIENDASSLLLFGKTSVEKGSDASAGRSYLVNKAMETVRGWCRSCACTSCHCQAPSFTKASIYKSCTNCVAVIWKNIIKFKRNPGLLIFMFLLPMFQICVFCLAIGGDPTDLSVTIVNQDATNPGFGDMFIEQLDNTTIHKKYAVSEAEGRQQVVDGHSWAVVYIGSNFTEDMMKRVLEGLKADNETLEGSTIEISMDETNEQIALVLVREFQSAYEAFVEKAVKLLNGNPKAVASPVQFGPHIYGPKTLKFTYYIAPGILVSISFGMAIGLTAITLILERKEGLLDRSWVAGVNVFEVVFSHAVTQLFIIIVQMMFMVIFLILVFKIPCEGNVAYVLLLVILQGMTGMSCGLLISALCDTEIAAVQLAMGLFYPTLLLSGIIWPIEAMPLWLRYISYCLPTMYAAKSMRSIMSRGWGLDWQVVWTGYLITIAWFLLLLLLSAIGLKKKK
ncbi:ABC transporter G family member 20-like [Corticium candelabrum]|uniref:ABC transporter G family member 20-like n=1 Tax=Corticium candelabrum TaxID=121492 RepID=UPI002E25A30E|nr:ABC transporter G family member 20-like [Corticium candelabrum]